MAPLQARPPAMHFTRRGADRPVAVVGITHPQTSLVLRGRLGALRQAGFRVILISSPGEWASRLAAEEYAQHIPISMNRGISPLDDIAALARLCFTLRRLRPHLTEFSTPKAGLLGCVAAWLCRVPTRIYMLRGLRLETATGLTRSLLKAAERVAASCSHTVVCNSPSLGKRAQALGIVPREKLHLIAHGSSNGVDITRFAPGPDSIGISLGIPPRAPVIGYVGRLTRDKGIADLLDAFDRIVRARPDARLLLVGWFDESEDRLSSDVSARIASHSQIIYTGFVQNPAPYYRAMDVLVLPTWREGFPNVALEAAASEVPVITTFTTGAQDAVLPGVTGLLVPPGSPDHLASSVESLLNDDDLRSTMGQAARRWAASQFDRPRVLRQTVAFYRDLVRSAAPEPMRILARDAEPAVE